MSNTPFYTKTETDHKVQEAKSQAYLGIATTTTTPPIEGVYWYRVMTAGTYTNFLSGGNPIVVTQAELDNNFVYFNVANGVVTKEVTDKPVADISKIENLVFESDNQLDYSITNNENATGVLVTAINDIPFQIAGVLSTISGRFPLSGDLILFIADNKVVISPTKYSFNIVKKFTVNVPTVEDNTIDITSLGIIVKEGQYLGISLESPIKPYYGVDESFGKDWFQTSLETPEGSNVVFTHVDNATFSIGFEILEENYVKKEDFLEFTNKLINIEKAYTLPTDLINIEAVPILLGNLVPAPKSGTIVSINLLANVVGVANFQIFERISFGAIAGQTDSFRAKGKFSITTTVVGMKSYTLTEEVKIKKGEYIALCGESGKVSPSLSQNDNYLGWFAYNPGTVTEGSVVNMSIENGTILFEYTIESMNYMESEDESSEIVKITAVKNAENYNSIRNLINSLTDASEAKQYEVFVPKGTWNEIDWKGKKWVKIIGESRDETIINLDPLGTMAAKTIPADYSFPAEVGKALNTVNSIYLHIAFPSNDIHCENLTFFAKNSKYPVHIDHPGFQNANFPNCRIKEQNCAFPIGMGIWSGQKVTFDNCIIEPLTPGNKGFFYHNWNNQEKPNSVVFNRGKFVNCDYGLIDELGSMQDDWVKILDCFTTKSANGGDLNFMVDNLSPGTSFWINPATGVAETNPVNVPYSIKLNTTGTKINALNVSVNSTWSATPVQRDIEIIKEKSIINI